MFISWFRVYLSLIIKKVACVCVRCMNYNNRSFNNEVSFNSSVTASIYSVNQAKLYYQNKGSLYDQARSLDRDAEQKINDFQWRNGRMFSIYGKLVNCTKSNRNSPLFYRPLLFICDASERILSHLNTY